MITTTPSAHPAVTLSQTELDLLDAGAHMDDIISRHADALAFYGPEDDEVIILARFEASAREAFAKAHRLAVRERRARA